MLAGAYNVASSRVTCVGQVKGWGPDKERSADPLGKTLGTTPIPSFVLFSQLPLCGI